MKHPHILLISLETLRRDHLGCYGCQRPLMPHLDRLAEGGVLFQDMVANCGWTLPQHMTLMTGLYPLSHGVTLWDSPPLSHGKKLLAEHLKEQGYRTLAGVSVRNHFGGGAKFGFDRGFDEHLPGAEYNQHMPWTEGFVLDRFREHGTSGPCFVYVHVNDSHEPFRPPEPWYSMWGESYHSRYEGQLGYVDHYLGRIFAGLKEMGLWEQTLVVIFADHGTEIWEHAFIEKKCNLYNEILHVPLIMHLPGVIPEGRVVEGLAESAQVAPTILDAAGLQALPQAQGVSLWPRVMGWAGEPLPHVCAHTVHSHQREYGPPQFDHYAIHTRDWKLIRAELHAHPDALFADWKQRFQAIMLRAGRDPAELEAGAVIRELYDLRIDPGEHRSLLRPNELAGGGPHFPHRLTPEQARALASEMEATLDSWTAETSRAR